MLVKMLLPVAFYKTSSDLIRWLLRSMHALLRFQLCFYSLLVLCVLLVTLSDLIFYYHKYDFYRHSFQPVKSIQKIYNLN